MKKLVEWKNKENRKPLIIRGARQVGKTWIMKEFGRRHFKNVAYVNFDEVLRPYGLTFSDFPGFSFDSYFSKFLCYLCRI